MKNRIAVAAVLLAIVLAGFLFEALVILPVLLVGVLGVVCYHELADMAGREGIRMSRRVGFAMVAGMVLLGWYQLMGESFLFLGLAVVLAAGWRMRQTPLEGAWRDIGATVGGIAYIGLPIAVVVELFVRSADTRALLLLLFAVAWAGDTGAMLAGRRFGTRRIFPVLSPGKTLEGCLGGLAAAMLPALLARLFFPGSLSWIGDLHLVLLCLALGALGQLGDLAESLLKRSAGVKDSGTILGGHGGALDRVDSLLFMAVPFALHIRLFHPEILLH